jgi:hypothetical protein
MESYRGTSKPLDQVIRRKDDLLKLVDSFSGDGKFAATVNTDPRTLRLDVRATAATFSQVAPFGLLVPFAGFAYFGFRTVDSGPAIMEQPSPQKPPSPPGKWAPKPQPKTKPNPPKTLEKTTH